jgi:hypothetical protein
MADHTPAIRRANEIAWVPKPGGKGPDAQTLLRRSSFVISCPACPWRLLTGIHGRHAQAAADQHEWQHHPERRPPPEAVEPAHELISARPAGGGTMRLDCRCGIGWTGPSDAVERIMSEHLSGHQPDCAEPDARR